jgi:hypothetical protein
MISNKNEGVGEASKIEFQTSGRLAESKLHELGKTFYMKGSALKKQVTCPMSRGIMQDH